MKQILFVCTGNTCRSSMAEALFNAAVSRDPQMCGKYYASSAGIAAFDGLPASSHSISVLKNWGIDLSAHRSRRLTEDLIHDAFLIFTMTYSHKNALNSLYPAAKAKTHTLTEFAGNVQSHGDGSLSDCGLDIADPFGMTIDTYKKCAHEIREAVGKIIFRLKDMES